MTRTTNARIAGFTFLFYIAVGITSMILLGRATSGEGIAAKLASIAQHETHVRVVVLLTLLMSFSAIGLGVTLWAITREQDPDLAMLAMTCRVVEGVNGASSIPRTLGLCLPLQLFGSIRSFEGPVGWLMWLPMLVFEVWFALGLLIKGVAAPATR
jgi:hypothetical protein